MFMQNDVKVVDGRDKVLGRVASQVAKMLLSGDKVVLINAEKLFVSGHTRFLTENYKQRLDFKDRANPEHSPYWSRRPDLFVKRVVRGMLPYKKPKGKAAFRMLKVYSGVPEAYKGTKPVEVSSKNQSQIFEDTIYVQELMKKLGFNN